jgi:hypothetical protein
MGILWKKIGLLGTTKKLADHLKTLTSQIFHAP